jgi:clan AA aspartic protease
MLNAKYPSRFTRNIEDCMGEIQTAMHLENTIDRGAFKEKYIEEHKIRSVEIEGIADTGARTLALPEDVIERLGISERREVKVHYADDRSEMRSIVGPITITIAERSTYVDAIVLPAGSEALIGQIVLERLDLVADCAEETLVPSPDSPHYPELSLR